MNYKLPPLNALRAFESAARQLSISRAAAELFVTPAAVSHQVKLLEEHLGTALFVRTHRKLTLTQAGAALLPGVRAGFEQLQEAVAQLDAQRADRPLTVSANISFCSKWLIPRLEHFRRRHPEIEVRIDASNSLVDFSNDTVDLAIRFGGGVYPGLESIKLFDSRIFPVCSPALPSSEKPLARPEDLRHHTLLHPDWFSEDDNWWDWRTWLLSAGLTDIDAKKGLQFNQTELAIQAAIAGQGVALVSDILVADDLASGRLIKPFELAVDVDFTFHLVYPQRYAERAHVQLFSAWLQEVLAAE